MQEKTNIIWDLSGTLLRPKDSGFSPQENEDLSLIFYMWSGKTEPSKLDEYALDLLQQAEEERPEYQVIRMHTGDPVPAIVCTWLAGLLSCASAYKKVMHCAINCKPDHLSSAELNQVYRMIEKFFDPFSIARCMHPIKETLDLAKLCAQNSSNTLYVISNWDKESFEELLTLKGDIILPEFKRENILISADIGYIKPQPEIYAAFLSRYTLDPSTCFFVDDQSENIQGARTFGIEGFQYKSGEITRLADILATLGIIRNI